MAFTANTTLDAPTGLTMKWSVLDGSTLHASLRNLTTGLAEVGTSGLYYWTSASLPDGLRGTVVFHTNTLTTTADLAPATRYGTLPLCPADVERVEKSLPDAVAGASGGLHINGSNAGTTTYAALTVTGAFTVTGGAVYNHTGQTTKYAATIATGDLSDISATRAAKIDNLDAAVSSRMATFTYATPPTAAATATAVRTELGTELGRIDVAISTRSTYAGGSVTLAASQPNYAPAKAGDAMTLTAAYDPAKAAAPTAAAVSTQVLADLATAHGSGAWTTADLTALASALTALAAEVAKVPRDGKSATYTQTASDAAAKSATVTIGAVG